MNRRQSTSIRQKLQFIILATVGTVLILSLLMMMIMEVVSAKHESETRLRALANVIGANSRAAITFLDQQAAEEVLNTLVTQKDVLRAQLIKINGEIFAQYQSPLLQKYNRNNNNLFNKRLIVKETIILQNEAVGSILIEGDMSRVRKTIINQGLITLGVLFISMVLAVLISSRLQKIISKPINHLLATMIAVTNHQDFSQRAERLSNDELGSLVDGFNNMLEHIQQRDQELAIYRENLEQRVEERTKELAEKNSELTRISRTDWLTGLNNRLRLDELFEQEISRSTRYKVPFSIILLDIDKFKQVNDSYGHDVGDNILIEFANILCCYVRESDYVGRWGGDEFLIICPETEQTGVIKLAKHLRQQIIMHKFSSIGKNTSSFGTSTYKAGDKIDTMIKRADMALLYVKENGRNQVESGEKIINSH
ncbi:MAG: diguanylate cyclase [Pseudomonadota bacterium]